MGCRMMDLFLVNGLVVAVVDAVAAFDALDVVDGELLLLFHDGAVGAFGLAGAALDAAVRSSNRR